MPTKFFQTRSLIVCTRHKKEVVVAPLLEKDLGVRCIVPEELDTDQFGTFSGELERMDSPLITLRKKCLFGIEKMRGDLGFASEGSFGSHPNLPFVQVNEELVILIDLKNKLEIVGRALTTETNFSGTKICDIQDALEFAAQVGLPSHGLIVKENKQSSTPLAKGVTSKDELLKVVDQELKNTDSLWLETDMRAYVNPTRMRAIQSATLDLLKNIASLCPTCGTPGYTITNAHRGLPCSYCGYPTQSILKHELTCTKCGHSDVIYFPYKKKVEDPTYCDHCNP